MLGEKFWPPGKRMKIRSRRTFTHLCRGHWNAGDLVLFAFRLPARSCEDLVSLAFRSIPQSSNISQGCHDTSIVAIGKQSKYKQIGRIQESRYLYTLRTFIHHTCCICYDWMIRRFIRGSCSRFQMGLRRLPLYLSLGGTPETYSFPISSLLSLASCIYT